MDCNYYPFIKDLTTLGVPILLSTGMHLSGEICKTVEIIKDAGVELTLFHCVATYPTKYDEVNLSYLNFLKSLQPDRLGLSDHSEDNDLVLMSIPYGIDIIEKHITLDKTQDGPDHPFALDREGCLLWRQKTNQAVLVWAMVIRTFPRGKRRTERYIGV